MTLTWTALSNVNFLCMPGEQLPQDWTEMFDFVILNDVFYDAYVEDGILTEVRRVLKSDRFCSFLWVCYLVFPWIFLVLTARVWCWLGLRKAEEADSVWSTSEKWISTWCKKELSSKFDLFWPHTSWIPALHVNLIKFYETTSFTV